MSDFLKNNPILSQLLGVILFTIFFFTVGKAYIDRGDEKSREYVMEELSPKLDTLIVNNQETNKLLREGL
jgi:hypothetical protein